MLTIHLHVFSCLVILTVHLHVCSGQVVLTVHLHVCSGWVLTVHLHGQFKSFSQSTCLCSGPVTLTVHLHVFSGQVVLTVHLCIFSGRITLTVHRSVHLPTSGTGVTEHSLPHTPHPPTNFSPQGKASFSSCAPSMHKDFWGGAGRGGGTVSASSALVHCTGSFAATELFVRRVLFMPSCFKRGTDRD